MYIWIGCRLPEEFERDIRQLCQARNEQVGLDTVAFSLPQHISLKISFDTGADYVPVLDAVEAMLRHETPFYVNPSAIEQAGNILWITVHENGTLRRLHNRLDTELRNSFGIPQHLFDKAFLFHSTLFIGPEDRIQTMQTLLTDQVLPDSLYVDTFLLGVSLTGAPGTYHVVREIKV